MPDQNSIVVKDVRKSYFMNSIEIPVLKGVDAEFRTGEITAIVGPSGAGKTTLLNLLGALDRPTAGEIYYKNIAYSKMSDSEASRFRNRSIGFVFQFHNLLGEFTALENVMLPLMISGTDYRENLERSRELLIELGLQERLDHKPSEMSGGEQQRVAAARAIVAGPDFLLADEPSGNLDQKNSVLLMELLWNLCREKGHGFVIVTHNKDLAEKADRIIELYDGVIKIK